MAYTTIDKSDDYFNTVLYAGNSVDNTAITGVNFQPDLVWIRNRSITENHQWQDAVRGATGGEYYFIQSNQTAGDQTQGDGDGVVSLDSDGFTLGYTNSTGWNQSGSNYVSWNWLGANGTASNTDGSITSTVSANTTSGFSIITYTGTGSAATIGHGLGATPAMIITKARTAAYNWFCFHQSLGVSQQIVLDVTDAASSYSGYWSSVGTSTYGIGTNSNLNQSSINYVSYVFAEKKGFSKFGSYTGNGNADGPMIYTGFKPAFLIIKRTNVGNNWHMYDNKRDTYNVADAVLYPNSASAEGTDTTADFLSNGFKLRTTINFANGSGDSYIYMAFAENPFVTSTAIPTTAR